jgi:amino acid transporter
MAVAAVLPEQFAGQTTASVEEKTKLQRNLGRLDIVFFLLCTLVGLDTISSTAAKGPQGFTWLVFLGLLFFVPYGLLTAELSTSFPVEGGSYMWTRMGFGRFAAAIHVVLYWLSNPIWLGGSLTIVALTAYGEFFTPLQGISKYVFALAFIWTAVISAVLSFSVGKWIPTLGAFVRLLVLGFFTLSVVLYALENGVTGGFELGDFRPTYAGFITLVPLLFFNYVGFELPSAASEEMKNPQRDVPFAVLRSAIGTFVLYGAPILAILLLLPKSQVTNLRGFLDSIKTVFTVYGGEVTADGPVLRGAGQLLGEFTALAFIVALLSSGTTWIMGADRAIAAAGFDGSAPRVFGRISARHGTPVVVNLWSGILSTAMMLLAFQLSGGNADRYFNVMLGLAISTTTVSYLLVFPALARLRRTHPDVPRPYRIPGGHRTAWCVSAITTFWAALATVSLVWPGFGVGWFGTSGTPEEALAGVGFAGERLTFELTQMVPIGLVLLVGVFFYALGKRTLEREGQLRRAAAAPQADQPSKPLRAAG